MSSRRVAELNKPQVRKSFLYVGGAALGAAVLGFILMNFVLGGNGGSSPPAASPPAANAAVPKTELLPTKEHAPLRPGGRDPFVVGGGSGTQAAAAPAAAVATPAPSAATTTTATSATKPIYYEVLSTTEGTADVKVGGKEFKDATPGTKVSSDSSVYSIVDDCVFFQKSGERFRVCTGERYLA
jgi:hypothetical protein